MSIEKKIFLMIFEAGEVAESTLACALFLTRRTEENEYVIQPHS